MNIFALDNNPQVAAHLVCDEHLNKMILEGAQMLSTVACKLFGKPSSMLYKPTHENHPCTKWVAFKTANAQWLFEHIKELDNERRHRFNRHATNVHKSIAVAEYAMSVIRFNSWQYAATEHSEFPQVMPVEFVSSTPVESYRAYYCWKDRNRMTMHWTRRQIPEFIALSRSLAKSKANDDGVNYE